MSRVDDAWRRVSGAPHHSRDSSARLEQVGGGTHSLQHYPVESGGAGPVPGAGPEPLTDLVRVPARETEAVQHASPALNRLLVRGDNPDPIAVEQYRRLAGTLQDIQRDQGLKTLMITSALPGEGKTLTSANLALTLGDACRRQVLLIDADLRRPAQHRLFRLSNARGLGDVLQADDAAAPFVRLSEHVTILPAGHVDQPMALTSDRMRLFLQRCEAAFDWVLIDTAPVGFMPDGQVLSRLTRAVLFVIAAHATPYQLVTRAIAELGADCIVGTVLNRMHEEDIPAADYYYQYYSHAPRTR